MTQLQKNKLSSNVYTFWKIDLCRSEESDEENQLCVYYLLQYTNTHTITQYSTWNIVPKPSLGSGLTGFIQNRLNRDSLKNGRLLKLNWYNPDKHFF